MIWRVFYCYDNDFTVEIFMKYFSQVDQGEHSQLAVRRGGQPGRGRHQEGGVRPPVS